MFKNEKEEMEAHGNEAETVIAPSVRVEGDFVSEGNVRIEGEVKGSIATERDLIVGENAKITADVQARNGTVAGELHGDLRVFDRLELASTARVYGDIQAKVLSVAPGAMMRGQLVVGLEVTPSEKLAKAAPRSAARAETPVEEPEEKPTVVASRSSRSAREKKIEEILQQ